MAKGKIGAYWIIVPGALVALSMHNAMAQGAPPPDTAVPPPGAAGSAPPAFVNTTVNLRNGPGTTYTIVTKIPAGAPVAVAGCQAGWCQVSFQGQNGYVIATSVGPGGPPPPGAVAGGPIPPDAPPPGYYPPPPPVYVVPPYGYYGYGPYYGGYYGGWRGGGWGRRW
jgi:SH3-like domain-containing protein